MAQRRSPGMIEVDRTVTCKRCGDEQVAWVKSAKTGKFYLVAAYLDDGHVIANRFGFHKCRSAA